ncbi:MAG: FAD-dependent oxidoreductase, partial [Mycobacteriaceae bacterium]
LHCDGGSGVEQVAAEAVVLAVPPLAAAALAPAGSVEAPKGWAQQLGSSPIVNVHVIFDRPVLEEDFFAGLGGPVQWVFDRTATAGVRSGQYLAVSLSAADDVVDLTTAEVRGLILPALFALVPAARHALVRDFFVTRSRAATFRPAPGTAAFRPPNATHAPGLVLAGAHTDTGWPATMEGAVRSGDTAADVLLTNLGATTTEGARAA